MIIDSLTEEQRKLLYDMGKALQFMLEFCGYYEKCCECDFRTACYYLSMFSDELVSIGDGENGSKRKT